MSTWRELKNFWRYFTLPKEKKEILFFSEKSSYLSYMEGALEELLARGESICYVTSDPNDPIFDRKSDQITPLYFNTLLPYFFQRTDSPVVVMTLTELNRDHLKRSVNGSKYVYIYHALVSTHMMYAEGSFDHYDCILCVGPYQIEEIRKREKDLQLPPKELLEGGYYRLERIYQNHQKRPASTNQKKTILIAPSWGEKNILNTGGLEITGSLLEAGYRVIFRPHPELFKRAPDELETLLKAYESHPDFTLERSTGGDESMHQADLLIVDWSGIALEYAFGTERPVLAMDLPMKAKNPDWEKLGLPLFEAEVREKIGMVCPTAAEVPAMVAGMLDESEEYRDKIKALRENNIFHFGQSSKIAADAIQRYKKK